MSKKDSYLSDAEKRDRLALAGLAADRKTAMEPCPDDQRFAEFLEADPASPEQQSFVKHLAACESCRQKWLVLSEELVETDGKMTKTGAWYGNRGLLSVFGSACALAAGVMLYLAIDYRPATFNVADSPAPERAQEAPVDEELNQVAVTDSDVLPREKSRVEELAEADTAEPAADVVLDRKEESRVLMSVESAPKPASAPAELLEVQTSSKKAGPPDEAEGFSAKADGLKFQESLEAFFESFSSHCQSREAGGIQGVDLTNTAEQGRALLKFEETMEIPHKELIREIVQLLAQKEPVKDTELDELCRQTGRVTAEMDKAGP